MTCLFVFEFFHLDEIASGVLGYEAGCLPPSWTVNGWHMFKANVVAAYIAKGDACVTRAHQRCRRALNFLLSRA